MGRFVRKSWPGGVCRQNVERFIQREKTKEMNNDITALLLRVLSSIGYTDDKEQFAKKFIWACEKQALDSVAAALSKDLRPLIYQAPYLKTVLDSKRYRDTLLATCERNLEDYMRTVAPSLSEEQAAETERILKEF